MIACPFLSLPVLRGTLVSATASKLAMSVMPNGISYAVPVAKFGYVPVN
jgi:hypothetical protein